MRHDPGGGLPPALLGQILPGGHALHSVRCGSGFHLSMGRDPSEVESRRSRPFRPVGDAAVHRHLPGWLLLCLEKRRFGLGRNLRKTGELLMPLVSAVTDLEQLKNHPALASLLAWNKEA